MDKTSIQRLYKYIIILHVPFHYIDALMVTMIGLLYMYTACLILYHIVLQYCKQLIIVFSMIQFFSS